MKNWLCIGDKKNAKCLYAKVTIEEEIRPLYANSSQTHRVKCLTIYCYKRNAYVNQYVTSCPFFANATFESFSPYPLHLRELGEKK